MDLSGVAARDFFDRAGLPRTTTPADAMVTERWSAGVKRVHTSGNIAIVEGDLFSIRPDPDPRPDEDDVRPGWFGVIPRGDELGGSIITRSSSAVANEDAPTRRPPWTPGSGRRAAYRSARRRCGSRQAADPRWTRCGTAAPSSPSSRRFAIGTRAPWRRGWHPGVECSSCPCRTTRTRDAPGRRTTCRARGARAAVRVARVRGDAAGERGGHRDCAAADEGEDIVDDGERVFGSEAAQARQGRV